MERDKKGFVLAVITIPYIILRYPVTQYSLPLFGAGTKLAHLNALQRDNLSRRKRDSQDSLCWLGADVHLDLDGIPHRRPGIFFCEAVVYRVRSKFGRGDKGVGVDDVVGMYAGGGEGEGRVACARR